VMGAQHPCSAQTAAARQLLAVARSKASSPGKDRIRPIVDGPVRGVMLQKINFKGHIAQLAGSLQQRFGKGGVESVSRPHFAPLGGRR
jgi:hypothetical protein